MELRGKVVVVARATTNVGLALASRFVKEGADVIMVDTEEKSLAKLAFEIGARPFVSGLKEKTEIKRTVDDILKKYGRIDFYVSLPGLQYSNNDIFLEKEWARYWHADLMSVMYVAKYIFPEMIRRRCGYLINMVPRRRLLNEYQTESYSTLTHPFLSFSGRMSDIYGVSGIRISVVCSDISISKADGTLGSWQSNPELQNLSDIVVNGIRNEHFMIS